MKAAVFYEPNDLRVEDVSEPDIADDEVLVEVAACGFCGSDVEYYYGKSPVGTADGKGPLVLGSRVLRAGRRTREARRRATASPRATGSRSTRSRAATPACPAGRGSRSSARTCPSSA